MKFTLKNKVAVVTGGGNGIGKAISETFAEMGAIVHILDMNVDVAQQTANEINLKYGTTFFHKCDVTKFKKVDLIFKEINSIKNGIDILINNAGIGFVGNIEQTEEGAQLRFDPKLN